MEFTRSRCNSDINALASSKLIAFFQTLYYSLNPSIYCLSRKNFGGYHERTLKTWRSNILQWYQMTTVKLKLSDQGMKTE